MSTSTRPTLIMIDGHALAYRQFFALPLETFSTSDGEPTNATFGFARTLLDVLEKDQPAYLLLTFDRGLSGRDVLFEDYKGTREKMPDELRVQMDRIEELVEAFNIPIMTLDGYEADDVLGTLALQAEAAGVDVLIITGDRDLLQLVTDHTQVRLPPSRWSQGDQLFDPASFREKYELEPIQLVDLKAMMGDSSDNIPGVKGIGEKGATKLLKAYSTLDGVYENLESLPAGQRKKLETDREMAYTSQKLARILRDIPITLDLDTCVAHDFDRDRIAELFRVLEFRQLVKRLPGYTEVPLPSTEPTGPTQLSMFGEADASGPETLTVPIQTGIDSIMVQDKAALDALVILLNSASAIAFDTETTSTDQMRADLVGIALSVDPGVGYYVPVGHVSTAGDGQDALLEDAEVRQLPVDVVLDALRPALTNPGIPKFAHNGKYDLVVMRRAGIDVTPITFDTMIAEWLSNPASRNKGLKNLAWVRMGMEMVPIEALIGKGRNQLTIDRVAIERAGPYACADAAATLQLSQILRPELEEKQVYKLYHDIEMPLIPILADMEMKGIKLDVEFLNEMSVTLGERLQTLEEEIHGLSGGYGPFNINSPKQLNDVIFGKLQLPTDGIKKTSHGFSTSADVLEGLKDKHAIIGHILEHRELTKLKGTYVDALPELVHPETGRVHTSYNQTGTVTGRISSDNPNLQNIPVRTELGRQTRQAFVAPKGHVLLAVDYSQVELRVLAHISEDPTLLEAFQQGQDIHRTTAAAVYDIPFEDVTYDQRRFAKSVNFGLLYGMGAFRLARDSDLTLAQANDFIKAYFERFPQVSAYLDETRALAASQGYLETLLGRRRYFPELLTASNALVRQRAERQAINMPIQGTAADIMKLAMIHVHQRIRDEGVPARMLLQVHDELVLEVAEDALQDVAKLVMTTMEDAFTLKAPLRADAQYGPNWLDMQEVV